MTTADDGFAAEFEDGGSLSARLCVSRDLKEFAHIWPRTDNMRGSLGYVFQCADVLEVWLDTIGKARKTEPLFIVIKNQRNVPWLALALGIEYRSGVRVLTFLDGGVSDYNAPILLSPSPPSFLRLDPLIRRLRDATTAFDIALFEKMPGSILGRDNPLVPPSLERDTVSGHVMTLRGCWESHLSRRARARQLRRKYAKLEKIGRAVFTIAEDSSSRASILDAMITQKSRRYLETRGWDGFDRPGYRQYFPMMTERLGSTVHLSALYLDNHIIATHWGLVLNSHFYVLMPSFDEQWGAFSPGRLLTEHLIEWNYCNDFQAIDFGVGDHGYKEEYCDISIPLYRSTIPVNPMGAAYRSALQCKRGVSGSRLGRWVRSQLSRHHTGR